MVACIVSSGRCNATALADQGSALLPLSWTLALYRRTDAREQFCEAKRKRPGKPGRFEIDFDENQSTE